MLDLIITGNDSLYDIINAIDEFLISENECMNFDLDIDSNVINRQEKSMHNIIASLESNGVSNAKEMTVFEIYQRIEHYEKVFKDMQAKKKVD